MVSDPPLRIALVSTQRAWYGGEEQFRLLARGLRRRGHEVHVLGRRGGALIQRMKDDGFAVAEFAGNGRNPLALWQIRRRLSRLRPDVLQYNDSHALTAAGIASWGLGIPVRVAMRHVLWPIRSPRRFRTFSNRIICVSRAVAEVCRAAGLPPEMLRVVFAAADPEAIRAGNRRQGRLAVGVDDCQPMILVVAGLNENKGHNFLLDAMPTVFGRYPNACLALAGDGPRQEPLELQAKQLGIDAQVRFLGYRRDVPDLIQAADLLVLPSLAEGLPVTLIDAMFAGVPFVATAIGGIADLTGSDDPHGESVAWVVPPRDGTALATAILEALDNPEQRTLRADRARKRAQQMFTADCMVDAMLEVYREALEERGKGEG
jgi:glycosyltransferase involved in cell wall biosynthesis